VNEDPLTASGEIVFPIQCKEFLEQEREMAVEQKPAAVEETPAAKQSDSVVPENSTPANIPVEAAPLAKRVVDVPGERAISSNDCTLYRTYDPASGAYSGYDGRRHSCR
jgi:hypothetical protein